MRILEILSQDKETLANKKAERTAKALKRKQESLIDSLEDQRDNLLQKRETLLSITIETVSTENWNREYQSAQVELAMLEAELKIARATLDELFNDNKG